MVFIHFGLNELLHTFYWKILMSILDRSAYTLRKHAYSNVLKIFAPKNENFRIKFFDIFHISAQNINCGYSLEPPRRVPTIYVLSRNKKNKGYPSKPQFYYIKVGFKGVKIIKACFRDVI